MRMTWDKGYGRMLAWWQCDVNTRHMTHIAKIIHCHNICHLQSTKLPWVVSLASFLAKLQGGCNSSWPWLQKMLNICIKIPHLHKGDICIICITEKCDEFVGSSNKVNLLNTSSISFKQTKISSHFWDLLIQQNLAFKAQTLFKR